MRKVFKLDIKSFGEDEDSRKFEGYASTYGNIDRHGDIVEKGAFSRCLADIKSSGIMPSLLMHHDLKRPVGIFEDLIDDEFGLKFNAELTSGVRDADEAHALLKHGALHSVSIGYMINRERYDHKTGINHLEDLSVHEISLVTIPANAQAVVTAVKNAEGIPDVREIERVLRDAGFSRRESKAFISEGLKGLTGNPVEETETALKGAETADQAELDAVALDRKNQIDELLRKLGK